MTVSYIISRHGGSSLNIPGTNVIGGGHHLAPLISAKICWWKILASLYGPTCLILVLTAEICMCFIWVENSLPFHMHRHDAIVIIFQVLSDIRIFDPLKFCKYLNIRNVPWKNCHFAFPLSSHCRKWVGAYASKYVQYVSYFSNKEIHRVY